MGMLARKSFPLGWTPDADAVDAPTGALLRADNMILDELDVLSLRLGSTRINSVPFADLDVHSLHTQYLAGVRYRMAGAGNHVYANGVQLPQVMDSIGDVPFGTHMGQIFYARGTTRLKYDGTTVRNWGIEMTGGQPTVGVSALSGISNELVSCDSTEAPPVVWQEDDGSGAAYATGQDGTPNGAIVLNPGANTRGTATKIWPTDQNLNDLGGGNVANDESIISFFVYIADPTKVFSIAILIGTGETYVDDHFIHSWFSTFDFDGNPSPSGDLVAGWNHLQVRRGTMFRVGNTFGRGWNTIRSVHLFTQGFVGGPDAQVLFDNVTITGGLDSGLTGEYEFRYIYVRDDGSYIIRSAPSVSSISASGELTQFTAQAAEVTVPVDLDRDGQINQIWVYRRGGELDGWYRTAVYSGAITSGAIVIIDTMTDQDALEIDELLEEDNITPPDNIIGIEGPYYDRLWVLTATHLHMSRRLSPDTFSTAQVIRVAGPDETPLWVKKAFGGLYVGTTKDIYRIDGTAAELPDGTIEVDFRPLSIDNPPRNEAVAQEGSLLCYMAADGWRAFTGAGSQLLVGNTSLLYKGRDRHGVEAVNIPTGRFRAAIAKSQLAALTPEGDDVESTTIQYRFSFTKQRWYRFTYSPEWRSIFREPDGTLIAGDSDGTVWTLDVEDSDATALIPVTIWTTRDGDGNNHAPKEASNLSINADTGGEALTIDFHLDESDDSSQTAARTASTMAPAAVDLTQIAAFNLIQLRLTGNFNRFRLSSFMLNYQALPVGVRAWDSGPMDIGQQDLVWIRRIRIKARAGAVLTITPYFDGVAFDPVTITPSDFDHVTLMDAPMGRGYFGKTPRIIINSAADFHLYWVEPLIRRTTEASEKENPRIPAGLGGEAQA